MSASTSELQALIRACKQKPEDDTVRFVLADWLEEHGEAARAEHLRLQIRIRRGSIWDPDATAIRDRRKILEQQYWNAWLGPLATLPVHASFDCGFIHIRLSSEPEVLAKLSPILRSPLWNWVDTIHVWEMAFPVFERLVAEGLLSGVSKLEFERGSLSENFARYLGGRPDLSGITHLTVEGASTEAFAILADSPYLTHLESLTLRGSGLELDRIPAFLRSSVLSNLRFLDLGNNQLSRNSIRTLQTGPSYPNLEELLLYGSLSDSEAFRAFTDLDASRYPRLTRLDLRSNPLRTEDRTHALAKAEVLRSVRILDLSNCSLDSDHLPGLLRSPYLQEVRDLSLSSNHLGSAVLPVILDSASLPHVERLCLSYSRLGHDSGTLLARLPGLGKVRTLNLGGNHLGPQAIAAIASSPHIARLEQLILAGNPIMEKGARALARSSHFDNLETLVLRNCQLGPRALALLRERFGSRLIV